MSSLEGRWVVVNFFASWCPPCQHEEPNSSRSRCDHVGVGTPTLLGVVYDDSAANASRFMRSAGATWTAVVDPGALKIAYGVTGPPETFVVAPTGVVVAHYIGPVTASSRPSDLAWSGGGVLTCANDYPEGPIGQDHGTGHEPSWAVLGRRSVIALACPEPRDVERRPPPHSVRPHSTRSFAARAVTTLGRRLVGGICGRDQTARAHRHRVGCLGLSDRLVSPEPVSGDRVAAAGERYRRPRVVRTDCRFRCCDRVIGVVFWRRHNCESEEDRLTPADEDRRLGQALAQVRPKRSSPVSRSGPRSTGRGSIQTKEKTSKSNATSCSNPCRTWRMSARPATFPTRTTSDFTTGTQREPPRCCVRSDRATPPSRRPPL